MPEVWPVTVNQDALRDSYQEQIEDNVQRFKPDVGPSIDLSRTVTAQQTITFQNWFTSDEYADLTDWYINTLKNGVLTFDRQHPDDAAITATFKFLDGGFRLVRRLPSQRLVEFKLYRVA